MPTVQPEPVVPVVGQQPCAVVWINGRKAIVAHTTPVGPSRLENIERGVNAEPAFLAAVVRSIGDCQRVLVLGPGSTRLDLEREYVSTFHRPDRLVDVEPAGAPSEDDLAATLLTLSS